MRRYDCELLPYIREDIFSHSTASAQHIGWEIEKFDIESNWRKTQGEGVVVAVIDTGCDLDHPDIKDNLIEGFNVLNKSKTPIDDNGHGSHVAGTIAAVNNGIGMVGIAPKTKIMPIKALNKEGAGRSIDIANGIVLASDNGADIITMSLGSEDKDYYISKAIDIAVKKGCVIFCAAGNAGPNKDIMYPAKNPKTIAIGAIDKNLRRTRFTCAGDTLDFLAPGQDIFSIVPDNSYAMMSGTSMSNPYVVGCASLLLSYERKINSSKVLSKDEYIKYFQKCTIPLKNESQRTKAYQGYGILSFKI